MNWIVLLCFLWINFVSIQALNNNEAKRLIKFIMRRYKYDTKRHNDFEDDFNDDDRPPVKSWNKPGHALLRPNLQMLKSSANFPEQDQSSNLVYGNFENLGIVYGKKPYRATYTNFRKSNILLDDLLQNSLKAKPKSPKHKWIIVEITPSKTNRNPLIDILTSVSTEEENNEREIDDDASEDSTYEEGISRRQSRSSSKSAFRQRETQEERSTSSSSDDQSSKEDKNPGNPYTTFKSKYKQNWLWNHFMDGDHMNINPYGPEMAPMTASAANLFFGRKWWYFNQDDYKPFG